MRHFFKNPLKMVKMIEKVAKKWKEYEEHNSYLKAKLAKALTKVQQLEDENNGIADKLTT